MTEVATSSSTAVKSHDRIYIDGQWVEPDGQGKLEVINSSTGEVAATIPEGSAVAATRAVPAARRAFPAWSELPAAERAAYLDKIKAGLRSRQDDLLNIIAVEVGMPPPLSPAYQLGSPPFIFGYYAKLAAEFPFEKEVGNSLVLYEPVGVVGALPP